MPASTLAGEIESPRSAHLRLNRCLRPSYRLDLMAAGDRCLLWVSGREQPGVHAVGHLLQTPVRESHTPTVAVELHLLPQPVPRAAWLADVRLSRAEVIRMPAGSNPSYVTPPQLAALDRLVDGDG